MGLTNTDLEKTLGRRLSAIGVLLQLSPHLEGEGMAIEVPGFQGGDRVDIGLPAPQLELLEAVVGRGKPVVLDWEREVEPGLSGVTVGGKQPGLRGLADAATTGVATGRFEVVGGAKTEF